MKYPTPLPSRRLLTGSSVALAVLGAVGLLLLSYISGPPPAAPTTGEELDYAVAVPAAETEETAYQESLEKELTAMLMQIAGAGNCQVFLTLTGGAKREFAEDVTENRQVTEEVDKQGGTRTITNVQTNSRVVTVRGPEGDVPVTKVEYRPSVQGVLVVAEGAGSAAVRLKITRAVSTVLGIAEYRVAVMEKRR